MPNLDGLIPYEKSVIISTEVDLPQLKELVLATKDVKGIGGYKIGMQLVLSASLPKTVATIRELTDLSIIFDYQKAGNDIPAMGKTFAKLCKDAGVDAAILLPFTGEATERAWIQALLEVGIKVLVGAHMTHEKFLWEEGGSIHSQAPERIYDIAIQEGVVDFIVPGTKLNFVKKYREMFDRLIGEGKFTLYAPGFITQGGSISEMSKVAGDNWHAIVGSGIYNQPDMKVAAEKAVNALA